jgi:hypothetical protein
MTALTTQTSGQDPFLLQAIATESLVAGDADGGPVALTCNCYGSCQGGLCSGTCCSNGPILGHTILEV